MLRTGEVVKAQEAASETSRVPSASVWISEASPRQYSVEELVKKIFGRRRAASRSSRPSLHPVTGSMLTVSLNGNALLIVGCSEAEGCPKRWVEVAAALTASDVDEHAVEHDALLLVLVKAEVKKLAQVSPALRCTEGVGVPDVAGAGVAILCTAIAQKCGGVARRQST